MLVKKTNVQINDQEKFTQIFTPDALEFLTLPAYGKLLKGGNDE
ncbi:hypothetical protein [Virgibacillus salidurans]|nr:hypothetical protein [Virgibacillus sp. NKC19-16]